MECELKTILEQSQKNIKTKDEASKQIRVGTNTNYLWGKHVVEALDKLTSYTTW